jgi:hypothetical protein
LCIKRTGIRPLLFIAHDHVADIDVFSIAEEGKRRGEEKQKCTR